MKDDIHRLVEDGNICPICGKGILHKHFHPKYEFKVLNKKLKIDNITTFDCDNCGEGFFGNNSSKRMDELVIEIRKEQENV